MMNPSSTHLVIYKSCEDYIDRSVDQEEPYMDDYMSNVGNTHVLKKVVISRKRVIHTALALNDKNYCLFQKQIYLEQVGKIAKLCTLMQKCRPLLGVIENEQMTDSLRKNIMVMLLRTLVRLHEEGILHLNIKMSNVLVDSEGRLVFTDFGMECDERTCYRGEKNYYRPQEGFRKNGFSSKSDVYSLGVVFIEICRGALIDRQFIRKQPLHERPIDDLFGEEGRCKVGNAYFQEVIIGMMRLEANQRLDAKEALQRMEACLNNTISTISHATSSSVLSTLEF